MGYKPQFKVSEPKGTGQIFIEHIPTGYNTLLGKKYSQLFKEKAKAMTTPRGQDILASIYSGINFVKD